MHRQLPLIALLLLALVSLGQSKFYKTSGMKILDPEGKEIQLVGTNLGNWLVPEGYMFKFKKTSSPSEIHRAFSQMMGEEAAVKFWDEFQRVYITKDDIQWLANAGVNHIRLPFHYKMLTHEDYLGQDYHGFALLDSAISWCEAAQIGVVLDMHCAPGGQTGDNIDDSQGYPFLFTEKKHQDTFVSVWEDIAKRYNENKTVIGYGLMNEPIAHYFEEDYDILNTALEPLYKRVTLAIREIDSNHILFYGGAQWNTNFKVFGKPFDDNAVYEFHKYWMPTVVAEIQEYLDYSNKYNVPIYCGETGENSDNWVMGFRTLLDEKEINWAFWPYKKMNNTKGIMNFKQPVAYDSVITFVESDRSSYKSIRENRPDKMVVSKAFDDYLLNAKLENCFPNGGYCDGLSLRHH